jgi:CheY-like chemotaxis protein
MKIKDSTNGKPRVLMIDDDENFCDVYKALLETTDLYSVTTANNGREGLKLAREHKPDVILVDIVMPDMNGLVVVRLLSNNEVTKNIPYIFITSLIEGYMNSIINKHYYLGKPFRLDDLINIIEEVLMHDYPNLSCLQ